jgi:uncharacterized cupin superfamily protein
VTLVHWDDVEGFDIPDGVRPLGGRWQRLGDAAGSVAVGAQRVRLEQGQLMTPPHTHTAEEEIFHVLRGSATLWQDGKTCTVAAGDTIVYVPGDTAHTIGGAKRSGLNWIALPANDEGAPPHCHSAEEAVFVVLDGGGTLELWGPPKPGEPPATEPAETHALRRGHLVARPPGSRSSHSFRSGHAAREPGDVAYYPRSNKI